MIKPSCGWLDSQALNRAIKDYHQGLPLNVGAFVDDIILVFHDDWRKVGRCDYADGRSQDIILPRVDVEGGEKDIFLDAINPEDIIDGFIPERGHNYRVKVRRISIDHSDLNSKYELLEVLSAD